MDLHRPWRVNVVRHLVARTAGDNLGTQFRDNLFHERLRIARNLYKKDLVSHYGCVNAIEFSAEGELLVSGGDDRRVLLWNVDKSIMEKESPVAMQKQHLSNIFCLGLDSRNSRIFSGGNDDVVIVHDVETRESVDVFLHSKPVYGLSIDPANDSIFATAGEDGKVLIFDVRDSSDVMCVSRSRSPYHAVMHHPYDAGFIVTANAKEGAALWDLRSPKMPTIRYGGDNSAQSCMSVRFNGAGTQVLALRRRLPPILYSTASPDAICQFYHPDYYNSCTMKSCCFAGENDQYVLSGSDDFNLYVWRVTDADVTGKDQWVERNQMVLYGHRSIVNQVRYNPQKCLIASSGVEKIVKLWTPFELESWRGSLTEENQPENPREVFTNEEYISLNMTHDYSHQSTSEDPRMMAFFDYLVQQEIEGWNSETSDQSSEHSSDENESSRPDTTQTSDTDAVQNYIPMRGQQQNRRGDVAQRTKYRNRIAYLIATKRNRLKRLALKSANARTTNRRTITKAKYGALRNQPKRPGLGALRTTRKGIGKRNRRLSSSKYNKRPAISHEQTSDSEVPNKQSTKKRRLQTTNLNLAVYRTFRRKSKGAATPSSNSNTSTRVEESSSDDDDDDDDAGNDSEQQHSAAKKRRLMEALSSLPSTSRSFPASCNSNGAGPSGLCNAGRSASTSAVAGGSSTSATSRSIIGLDTPSTSTGLTGNGRNLLFHIASTTNDDDDSDDSDDDPSIPEHPASPDNMLRVITSPINHFEIPSTAGGSGSGANAASSSVDHNGNNMLDRSNNNDSYVNHNNQNNNGGNARAASGRVPNGVQKQRSLVDQNESSSSYNQVYDHTYSSRSNSRLSSSYDYDCSSSNDETFAEYFNNKKKLMACAATNGNNRPEDEDEEDDEVPSRRRPDYNRDLLNHTPDSGIATGPCSSVSTAGGMPSSTKRMNVTPGTMEPTPGPSSQGTAELTASSKQLFQAKVARVRKNYRKHFCDDSDSE